MIVLTCEYVINSTRVTISVGNGFSDCIHDLDVVEGLAVPLKEVFFDHSAYLYLVIYVSKTAFLGVQLKRERT